MDKMLYQTSSQINGTAVHKNVDEKKYSSKSSIITGLDVYCEEYNLIGKIDIYDADRKILCERKKKIIQIYDGYIFQLYAQYFALVEMGYEVRNLRLHSIDDNKSYNVKLPSEDDDMHMKFKKTVKNIRDFSFDNFVQTNIEKCKHCIYEPACDRTLLME